MQVWTKPDDSGPPVSLGLFETGTSPALTVDGLPTPQLCQLYEVTTEPAGGSPINLPTGPILGKGLAKVLVRLAPCKVEVPFAKICASAPAGWGADPLKNYFFRSVFLFVLGLGLT